MSNNIWSMTQTPSGIGAGFAMPASGLVAPIALVSYEATRDRHAVASKQLKGTPVWSPPT